MNRTPIKTLELAKRFFCAMGCMHFHMAREYPNRYKEYKKLNISENTELQWKTEYFYQEFDEIMGNDNGEKIWVFFSQIEEIVYAINTDDVYEKMLIVARQALKTVEDGCRVVVAETINGRKEHEYRSGYIFHSFDRGRQDHAIEFINLSLLLSESDKNGNERAKSAINDCRLIKRELGL